MFRSLMIGVMVIGLVGVGRLEAAELTVGDLAILQDSTSAITVYGSIDGESTYGVNILVEIVPRVSCLGTLSFTSAPPVDVYQVGDPWPFAGTFSAYDTDSTGSIMLNGSVDDNGTFLPEATIFSGALTTFGVVASIDAEGVWDVVLSTSAGDSSWEGLATTFIAGTVTVSPPECYDNPDCDDGLFCNGAETCVTGSCQAGSNPCPGQMCDETNDVCVDCLGDPDCDDGEFCNGAEACVGGSCQAGSDPCLPAEFCNETTDTCDECQVDGDCTDGIGCTDDGCVTGSCVFTTNDANCPDDGLYCNGTEFCDSVLDCSSTGNPCLPQACDEASDSCESCTTNAECDDDNICTDDVCSVGICEYTNNTADCDDGLFCTGSDVCVEGVCVSSGDPCSAPLMCSEDLDQCVQCLTGADCDDGNVCTDDICDISGACSNPNNIASCDDGLFCTATDVCNNGTCVGSGDPCLGQVCDESIDACVDASAALSVETLYMGQDAIADLVVSGQIAGFDTFGVTIYVEIIPRAGSVGTVVFTVAPPTDIHQIDDPWPGAGIFTTYDTDSTGSSLLNGSVDDNGTFVPCSLTFTGSLVAFPVMSSANAGGVWDVVLSTYVGNSAWEGVTTTLAAGTITVAPNVSLSIGSFAMPPGATVDAVVSGEVEDQSTYGVTIMVELVPRAGAVGTLTFTPAPPDDIYQVGDPWPGLGSFTLYDTNSTGSAVLNGYIDDNGSFLPGLLNYVGDLAGFPVTASSGADGVWDITLSTSSGTSSWEDLTTVLVDGSITVTADACVHNINCDDGNTCTADVCNAGYCEYTVLTGACNDGDLCTENDTCQGDVCVGTPVDCSSLDDACNVGTCNPVTGDCETTPTNEGGSCDDNDLCTENDICTTGVCSGTLIDCTAFDDVCNVGTCNPATGACEATSVNEGGACDDNDLCTTDDVCLSGGCYGDSVDCSHLTDACNLGACNPMTGTCTAITANEGGHCEDGDLCTWNDVCTAGVCDGTPADCSSLDDTCNAGTCNPATGECEAVPTNEGGPCDDADPCTENDTCSSGVCAGTSIPGCINCYTDPECDDGNVCTSDACIGGACQYTYLTSSCNDGNRCTLNDVCSAGVCAGTPVDCSGLNTGCKVGVCNPSTGTCYAQSANEGGSCNDGLPCTTNDICVNGVCRGTLTDPPSVNLSWSPSSQTVLVGEVVRIDLVASSATCINQPVAGIDAILNWEPEFLRLDGRIRPVPNLWLSSGFPNDSGLDGLNAPFGAVPGNDGDALYQALRSFMSGVIVPPSGVVVVTFQFTALDGTVGTQITIPPSAGSYTSTQVLGGGEYLGLDVTGTLGTATVQIAECQNGADCNDGNVCTTDVCNTGVCEYSNNTVPCDDGLFCTATDVCGGGSCAGSSNPCSAPLLCSEGLDACVECLTANDCNDANICTNDVCNAFGTCENPNNTVPCDDGLFCTATDVCGGGTCNGSGDACPGEVCDEANNRCVECLIHGDCDDANLCTDEVCTANICEYTNNTIPCDDGLFCTLTDICTNGVCVGNGSPCDPSLVCSETLDACVECEINEHCDDDNVCTTDLCLYNICTNNANLLPCDDGFFCTANDVCIAGACVGSGDACPGELCDETNNVCVECFTVADCADDGVGCTVDACVDGVCVYPPDDTLCDDGLFCNGPEFCSPLLDCQPGDSPCDDPALCDEDTHACGCQEPRVVAEGCRYLAVTPRPGNTPVALLVSGVDPEVSCISLYVQVDGTLGPAPVYRTPAGSGGWHTAHVRGWEIIPSVTFVVQTECDTGAGPGISTPASDTTWMWGDTDNSGGLVDILDLTLIVDGFRGTFEQATLYSTDIWGESPEICLPQLVIDILDMTRAVDAFKQDPYPCTVDPCP